MKKRIIFVTKALWIGGIETALINLLNHFDYENYDVTLLILHAETDMLEQVHPKCRVLIADREKTVTFKKKYAYSRLYHLTEEATHPSVLHQAMMWSVPAIKWIENRLYIGYIREMMKGEKYDTCIIYSDVVAEISIRTIQAKKFFMFYHHGAMRHVYHDEIGYRKCEKIITVSENQANELKKFVPNVADRIIAIHNLTDVKGIRKKATQPTEEIFDETKFNIVSVGRVSHEKGMDIAVRACACLVENGYNNICWWIVGGGSAMQEVLDTIVETRMDKYVRTVGMKNNPYPYMRQADIYVQPSRFEGYPMTILEAMVLGSPVVSTANSGAKEIIRDGATGILCGYTAEELAVSIEQFITSSDKLKTYCSALERYDFEADNMDIMGRFYDLLS